VGDDVISVIDVAQHLGRRKGHVYKVLKRLGIEPVMRRSEQQKRTIGYITQEEFERVNVEFQSIASRDDAESDDGDDFVSVELGVFYLIQLEPELDPGRFKVGFAASMSERLRTFRCSAPFAVVLRTWPCRRLWERTAMDSVAAGCERLHTEVFRTGSLDEIMGRCERFFAVMPPVQSSTPNQALQQTGAACSLSGIRSPLSGPGC
jgi:hypothetical protein